jgi:hypothetical protein
MRPAGDDRYGRRAVLAPTEDGRNDTRERVQITELLIIKC